MPKDRYFDEFPVVDLEPLKKKKKPSLKMRFAAAKARPAVAPAETPTAEPANDDPEPGSNTPSWLEGLLQMGLAERTVRLGTHALLITLIIFVAWVMRQFYTTAQIVIPNKPAHAASLPTFTPIPVILELPPFQPPVVSAAGITRRVSLHTTLPTFPRTEVITYTVVLGDTLFGIAEKYGLEPETILWGNQFVLGDNPHNLRPGQVLNILPVNGTYYKWQAGDGFNGVAKFFGVTPEDIINFPGNHLDPLTIGDFANPNIPPGTWLVVPGGKREFVTWSAPVIPRDNPKVAEVLGPGVCGGAVDGAVGIGLFIWPANSHFLSGFDYSPKTNHMGIDVDGETGDPVYAVDNGVVVYSGWNNWGYGNMVVINHGNGWQTLYAHLDTLGVACGQSMYQGNSIGSLGSTGNSSGSHLHFEMMYNGTKVNPWDYLP